MAQNSSLTKRLCVAWRTDRPYRKRPRLSPQFTFQNCDWCLNVGFSETSEYYVELERKSTKYRFLTFDVTTYIENVADKNEAFFSQTMTVSHTPLRIWSVPESAILEKIPALKDCGEFSVVCVLHWVIDNSKDGTELPLHTPDVNLHSQPGLESLSTDLYKLLENDVLPDVKLRCENRIFSVHRAVLAARSEVFAAMFRNKMESETGISDITDVKSDVLDMFLKYLYSGKLPDLSEDTVPNLYMMSDKYAIHALKKVCCEWMVSGLKEENCLGFLKLADAHTDFPFKDQVISFISNNKKVLQSEHWFRFSEEIPKLAIEVYHRCFAKQIPNNQENGQSSATKTNQENGQSLITKTNQENGQSLITKTNQENGQSLITKTNQENGQSLITKTNQENGQSLITKTLHKNVQSTNTITHQKSDQFANTITHQKSDQFANTITHQKSDQFANTITHQKNNQIPTKFTGFSFGLNQSVGFSPQ